ncbi:hypothetical protein HAX54_040497, partial [Datura stramonium]|nr:hypothetical protein [Datura stramonium]
MANLECIWGEGGERIWYHPTPMMKDEVQRAHFFVGLAGSLDEHLTGVDYLLYFLKV